MAGLVRVSELMAQLEGRGSVQSAQVLESKQQFWSRKCQSGGGGQSGKVGGGVVEEGLELDQSVVELAEV